MSTVLPAELFRDDFYGGYLDTNKWEVSGAPPVGTATAADGILTLDNTNGSVALTSLVQNLDMVSSSVYVKLVSVEGDGEPIMFFGVIGEGSFLWESVDVSLFRASFNNGSEAVYSSFVEIDEFPVWLRIREEAGVAYWDYSSDGSSWTNHYSGSLIYPSQAMYANISIGASGEVPASYTFSNFNVGGF
jgi:hypothetical protein